MAHRMKVQEPPAQWSGTRPKRLCVLLVPITCWKRGRLYAELTMEEAKEFAMEHYSELTHHLGLIDEQNLRMNRNHQTHLPNLLSISFSISTNTYYTYSNLQRWLIMAYIREKTNRDPDTKSAGPYYYLQESYRDGTTKKVKTRHLAYLGKDPIIIRPAHEGLQQRINQIGRYPPWVPGKHASRLWLITYKS